tara:strand:- start:74 stop:310 length:237 start_codon:yes stop_codon:yes gene_type:complete
LGLDDGVYAIRKSAKRILTCPSFANPSLGFAVEGHNPLVRPTNFKGSLIKEALVVFRVVEKQGSAKGLLIRTPSPALA